MYGVVMMFLNGPELLTEKKQTVQLRRSRSWSN